MATNKQKEDEIQESINVGEPDAYRLKALHELKEKFHEYYVRIFTYGKKDQDKIIDHLIKYYIPNVMHDFPGLLSKIEIQKGYIKSLEEEVIELKKQRDKAYKKLGWKVYQFFDSAAHEE